jgi:hypothetical protein
LVGTVSWFTPFVTTGVPADFHADGFDTVESRFVVVCNVKLPSLVGQLYT